MAFVRLCVVTWPAGSQSCMVLHCRVLLFSVLYCPVRSSPVDLNLVRPSAFQSCCPHCRPAVLCPVLLSSISCCVPFSALLLSISYCRPLSRTAVLVLPFTNQYCCPRSPAALLFPVLWKVSLVSCWRCGRYSSRIRSKRKTPGGVSPCFS